MSKKVYESPLYGVVGKRQRNQFVRWIGLAVLVFSFLFVLLFSIAGFLRPGYSPIHQTISDLGVGQLAWLVDVPLVVMGLLMIALAVGFFQAAQSVVSSSWRWICAVLVALPGLGLATSGIFTEAPSTLLVHFLVGAVLGLYFPVLTFFVVGIQLVCNREWRGYGIYSLLAGLVIVALIGFLQVAFTPGTPLARLGLGGLAERMDLIGILVWYDVIGWRFYRNRTGS